MHKEAVFDVIEFQLQLQEKKRGIVVQKDLERE